jgi:hypothetical protein
MSEDSAATIDVNAGEVHCPYCLFPVVLRHASGF